MWSDGDLEDAVDFMCKDLWWAFDNDFWEEDDCWDMFEDEYDEWLFDECDDWSDDWESPWGCISREIAYEEDDWGWSGWYILDDQCENHWYEWPDNDSEDDCWDDTWDLLYEECFEDDAWITALDFDSYLMEDPWECMNIQWLDEMDWEDTDAEGDIVDEVFDMYCDDRDFLWKWGYDNDDLDDNSDECWEDRDDGYWDDCDEWYTDGWASPWQCINDWITEKDGGDYWEDEWEEFFEDESDLEIYWDFWEKIDHFYDYRWYYLGSWEEDYD